MRPTPAPGDALRSYIFDRINVRRCGFKEEVCWTIAENIAFLIRHDQGSAIDIDLNSISVTFTDVRSKHKCEIGHRAAVTVHEAPGKTKVIVENQVGWGKNVLEGLTHKVDTLVNEVVKEAGQTAKK